MKEISINDYDNSISKMLVKAKDSFVEFTNTESQLLMGIYPDIAKNGDVEPNLRSYVKSTSICKEYFNLRIVYPDQFIKIVKYMTKPTLKLSLNDKGVVTDFRISDERRMQRFKCIIPTGKPLNDAYDKARSLNPIGNFNLTKKDFKEILDTIRINEQAGHNDDLLEFQIKEDTGDVVVSSKSFYITFPKVYAANDINGVGLVNDGKFYIKFTEFKQFPIISDIIIGVAKHPVQDVLIYTFEQENKDTNIFTFAISCVKFQ